MYIFLSSHILQSSSRAAPKLLTCSDLPMENTPVFSISSAPRGPFPVLPHEQGMLLELILLASPSSSVFLIPTTTSFLMKLETQEAMTSMLAVTLGSQHCCAFRFPASEVSSRHHRRCPLHPNNESKRCRSTGLEAESYFGQCAASCQLKTQTFITEHVEVGSFNFLVLITSTSQRGGKLNPADFLVGWNTKRAAHLVGGAQCFAKSGPWMYAIQFSLSACDLTFQIFTSLVFMNTLFYELCLTSQFFHVIFVPC